MPVTRATRSASGLSGCAAMNCRRASGPGPCDRGARAPRCATRSSRDGRSPRDSSCRSDGARARARSSAPVATALRAASTRAISTRRSPWRRGGHREGAGVRREGSSALDSARRWRRRRRSNLLRGHRCGPQDDGRRRPGDHGRRLARRVMAGRRAEADDGPGHGQREYTDGDGRPGEGRRAGRNAGRGRADGGAGRLRQQAAVIALAAMERPSACCIFRVSSTDGSSREAASRRRRSQVGGADDAQLGGEPGIGGVMRHGLTRFLRGASSAPDDRPPRELLARPAEARGHGAERDLQRRRDLR